MSSAAKVLVWFHLVCVVGGFGSLGYSGLYLMLSRRRGGVLAAEVMEINSVVNGLAELLIYGAFVFGVAAVGANAKHWSFGQTWVWAAVALFLVDVGILHGWIKRHQRRYNSVTAELVSRSSRAGSEPAELGELATLEKRVSLGWGVFNLVVLVVVYLMVFKPGA